MGIVWDVDEGYLQVYFQIKLQLRSIFVQAN